MFLYFFHFILSLNDTCINLIDFNYDKNIYFNESNIYLIEECFYHRINSFEKSGGVMYFSNIYVLLSIKSSTFFNCSSLNSGGAIYFSTLIEGSFYSLYYICGYQCFSYGHQPFGAFSTLNSSHNDISQ